MTDVNIRCVRPNSPRHSTPTSESVFMKPTPQLPRIHKGRDVSAKESIFPSLKLHQHYFPMRSPFQDICGNSHPEPNGNSSMVFDETVRRGVKGTDSSLCRLDVLGSTKARETSSFEGSECIHGMCSNREGSAEDVFSSPTDVWTNCEMHRQKDNVSDISQNKHSLASNRIMDYNRRLETFDCSKPCTCIPNVVISDHCDDTDPFPSCSSVTDLSESPGFMTLPRSASSSSVRSDSSLSSSPSPIPRSESDMSFDDASDTDDFFAQRNKSSWKKIRNIVHWSPFIQQFKRHRYPWIQLAGHQGNFQAGEPGAVLKKFDSREQQSFKKLMSDPLKPFVPEYKGDVTKNTENYMQLQDLLCEFDSPSVMDVKMGTRTYLEEELVKAREKPKPRKDMYQKMIDVDQNAPTEKEHEQKGVTKPRYMQWRDEMSSSNNLGFRIEGIKKMDGGSTKNFKRTRTREEVRDALASFIGDNKAVTSKYLERLKDLRETQKTSSFFRGHEIIGSSLLFVHNKSGQGNVWMIDFGKTVPLPKDLSINHSDPWVEGNHEDGYMFGLDNLISIIEELSTSS